MTHTKTLPQSDPCVRVTKQGRMLGILERALASTFSLGAKLKPGWVAVAPQGDRAHVVHLVWDEGRRPSLRWACTEPWADPTQALRALRRSRPVQHQRTVALLQHGQYQLLTLPAPDLPREEWRDATRWHLKDMVAFAVESAGIDVLDIPTDPQQRRGASLMAVAAPRSALAPLADAGADAGLPWHALDVPETALRNVCVLCAEPDRGEALLHVGRAHSTLVITVQGELLVTRHIDVSLGQLTDTDESVRQQHYERATLELQRTLDNVERQFSHANLARLQVAPGTPLLGFIEHVRALVYVPVAAFDLGAVLDLSAVPELIDPAEQAAYLPAIGAALRARPPPGPRQINLLDASLQRRREPMGSVAALVAPAATLGVSVALTLVLHTLSTQTTSRAGTAEQELIALQARVAAVAGPVTPSRQAAELAHLRAVEFGQRRIRASLDSGQAGGTQGYSEYLLALSRQTQGTLWLTSFSVAPDGRSLELGGRMTDPRQLPAYLHRLNTEPLFKGREFAQLSLKTVEPGTTTDDTTPAAASYAEFALRATATASETH